MTPPIPTRVTGISQRFAELRQRGELGLVAYITAGDPSIASTESAVLAMAEAGADVIELGVPFSDPVADGPVIQRASDRALRGGTSLASVIELVKGLRAKTSVPLVIFSYFNPVLQYGTEKFANAAAAAGADGVLITDLPPEEAGEFSSMVRSAALDTIFLAAPTSTDERLKKIAECSSGFLYIISRTGVTGAKNDLPEELPAFIRRVRTATKLPLAVGFGISLPGHVSVLGGLVDAAVVGSALVSEMENAQSPAEAASAVAAKVRALKQAGHKGMGKRESAS